MRPDPVDAHLAELERSLRGPAGPRRGMLRELRDGLDDAAAAYRDAGLDPARAARLAVRDFGPVAGVAEQLQAELAAEQGRRTALLLAVAFPALLIGWDLVWRGGTGWGHEAPPVVRALAAFQDVASAVIAATALALLLVGLRRSAVPRRVALATGLAALGAVLLAGGAAVAMNIANPDDALALLVTRPAFGAAYLASVLVIAAVSAVAVRTLRTARWNPGAGR
jgi:hypothetical protein